MTIGEKIQRCRKGQKMSQEELAGKLGVSRQAVSKWELNESIPDTENVIELGKIFGVSLDYLLKEDIEDPDLRMESEGAQDSGDIQEPRQEEKKRIRHPLMLVLVVVSVLYIIWMITHDAPMIGVISILNIWTVFGMGYVIYLVVKALKKYIQR